MRKVRKITRTQDVIFIVWDGLDETVELIQNEMLPKLNLVDGRLFSISKQDSEHEGLILIISEIEENGSSNSYYRVNDIIVLDYNPLDEYGIPLEKDEIIYYIHGYSRINFHKFYKI